LYDKYKGNKESKLPMFCFVPEFFHSQEDARAAK